MAIRCGYTVGRTTSESSLADQLKRYRVKEIKSEEMRKPGIARAPNPAHEKLVDKCIRVVVANFDHRPVTENIPPEHMAQITKLLPSNLDPIIGAKYIHNEGYWKRCCVDKHGWHNCQLAEHNLCWKQLYFEKLLQERLEDFDSLTEDIESLFNLIDACADFIFTVAFKQVPNCRY
jgi:hypothetical protein